MSSGSGEAFFRFSNDATENRAEVAAALHGTVSDINEAARAVGGTSIPMDWADQIAKGASRAAEQTRQALKGLLDPRQLAEATDTRHLTSVMVESSVGSIKHAQNEVARLLRQLGPDAHSTIAENDLLKPLMDNIATAIVHDAENAYEEFVGKLSAGLRAKIPATLPVDVRDAIHTRATDEHSSLVESQRIRAEALYRPINEEGNPDNGKPDYTQPIHTAFVDAELKAGQERLKVEKETLAIRREEARLKLSEQLAASINSPNNIYAKAAGLHVNPESGNPARRVGGGWEDISDPYEMERAFTKMQELGEAHRKTLNENFQPIKGTNSYVRQGEGDGAIFFKAATRGGIELYEQVSNIDTKTRSAAEAARLYAKEMEEAAKAAEQGTAAVAAKAGPVKGFLPGVMQGAFGKGFKGTEGLDKDAILGNLGTTIGSAARYSVAYGGFYQFLQASKDGLAIFQDYQDSFTDYQVALGGADSSTQATTNQLMELSRVLGENVGAAYDSAARGVRAFASDASDADKKIAGFATASAAQKISVIANKTLADATGDIVAVGGAYNMTASQSELLIPDWLANAKRNIGGDPTQIAQGLSNFAVTGAEAGYSGQEAADLIALVQSRTDQSGQAVSTRLTRIIQAVSGTPGKGLADTINRTLDQKVVDVDATPKLQLEQFARAYVLADQRGVKGLQALIRTSLGGTSNLKELIPILEESGADGALTKALQKALPGAGNDEYNRKVQNLIGTLNKLRGSIQNIVVLAANADLFAPFAIAVKTAEPVLHLLENILKVYEKIEGIPGSILKDVPGGNLVGPVVTTGIEGYLGYKAFKGVQKSAFAADLAENKTLTGTVARTIGAGADAVSAGASVVEAGAHKAAVNADTAATGRLTGATNFATAALERLGLVSNASAGKHVAEEGAGLLTKTGKFFGSKLGIATLVVGTALVAQEVYTKEHQAEKFRETKADLLSHLGADPKKLQTTVDALNSLSKNQKTDLGWLDKLQNFGGTSDAQRTTADAKAIQSIQKRVESEAALHGALNKTTVFGDAASRTVDTLSEAFAGLAEQGVGAHAQLKQYVKALLTPEADTLASYETPDATAATLLSNMEKALRSALPDKIGLDPHEARAGRVGALQPVSREKAGATLSDEFDEGAAYNSLVKSIKRGGKGFSQKDLEKAYADAFDVGVAGKAAGGVFKGAGALGGDLEEFRKQFLSQAELRFKIIKHQVGEIKPLSPAELKALLGAQDAATAEIDPGDPTAAARQARENYMDLLARQAAAGTRGQNIQRAIGKADQGKGLMDVISGASRRKAAADAARTFDAAKVALRNRKFQSEQADLAEAEDARQAAESRVKPGNTRLLQKVRLDNSKVGIDAAGDSVSLIEGLFENLDRKTVKALLLYKATAVNTTKIALDHANKLIAEAQALLGEQNDATGLTTPDGPGPFRDPTPKVDPKLKANRDAIKEQYKADKKAQKAALDAYDRATIGSANVTDGSEIPLTAYQVRTRTAQANEDPRNSTSVAYNNLQVAKANLAALGKRVSHKSAEYIDGMKAVAEAQDAYSQNLNSIVVSRANLVAAQAGGGAMASAVAALKIANNAISQTSAGTPERVDAETQKATAVWQARAAASAKIGSKANAQAARVGGGIASARAQITGAAAQMHSLARGTGEWYDALGSFYSGQEAMRQAVMQYRNNLDLLHGDNTDPVEQARDALRAAYRQLRSARSKDDRAAARVAIREGKQGLAGSKFDQRFSDMQTAEDLGRISFAKYMDYLDHEHDRLSKIKHRTRQQQDQLDQVDKAMKDSLSSMDSQFNLGDINTNGLVYQVRRFKAEASKQVSNQGQLQGPVTNQTVTITIPGADIPQIKRVIDGYLRIGGGQRRTLTARKG